MGALEIDDPKGNVLFNPALPEKEKDLVLRYQSELEGFSSHVWLMTSGSTRSVNDVKLIGLSWNALKTSAREVNAHFEVIQEDVWLNPLPLFHVGGLGIYVRSQLSGSKYIELKGKWNPLFFYQSLLDQSVTLTSLVPAQLYDLVKAHLKPPPTLRKVFIGGGVLSDFLKSQALTLGWPIVKTYGMTECSSQVAAAKMGEDELTPLKHIEIKTDREQNIYLKSPALLSYIAFLSLEKTSPVIMNPIKEGWYRTEDKGHFEKNILEVIGRGTDFLKIGGENVSLTKLETLLKELCLKNSCEEEPLLLAQPDERLGHVIVLVKSKKSDLILLNKILDQYHQKVSPFEKIRKIIEVEIIPRSSLGKPLKKAIQEQLAQN